MLSFVNSESRRAVMMASFRTLYLLACLGMAMSTEDNRSPPAGSFNLTSYARDQIANIVREELKAMRTASGPHDCAEIKSASANSTSGVYTVYPNGRRPMDVYCDMDTLGGGWLVFQRRYGGYVDFYRYWNDYSSGFGDIEEEHWLGNRKLHSLTSEKTYLLHIGLVDFDGNKRYAQYTDFKVASEQLRFALSIGSYSGDAGDSLSYHDGRPFSTRDKDYDDYYGNCASSYSGAWWYGACHSSNLNGLYLGGPHRSNANGIVWSAWKGVLYSMKATVMMFRPL